MKFLYIYNVRQREDYPLGVKETPKEVQENKSESKREEERNEHPNVIDNNEICNTRCRTCGNSRK